MASSSHRSGQSVDISGLQAPGRPAQPRRQSLATPSPGASPSRNRPPSPLRNGYVPADSSSGSQHTVDFQSIESNAPEWPARSPSPASSVSQHFATFTQRVLGGMSAPPSPSPRSAMPTDAELEAEAERERDRSRREAEQIMMQEARERKQVEDRVLEMMNKTQGLPPPPPHSEALPPSPSNSQKEAAGWWASAKNKLTPTKDKDLTPAQQIIQETKTKEKVKERERKNSKVKDSDPAFINLQTPQQQYQIPRRPVPSSPASPTPASALPPNLTPSPMRSLDISSSSPVGKDSLPLYATFDTQGTLDVPTTLLTIAKRFEKLEKWTVGHVRALEERMSDVERWLVDKEKDAEKEAGTPAPSGAPEALTDVREELSELQSRMGEMGREMARLATAPANLSAGPSKRSTEVSIAPTTSSSIVEHVMARSESPDDFGMLARTPSKDRYVPPSARQSTSPPLAGSSYPTPSTRLPYPSGDYASPSPAGSRGASPEVAERTQTKPMAIPGLPEPSGLTVSASSSYSNMSYTSVSSISPSNNGGTSPNPLQENTAKRPLPSPSRRSRLHSVSPSPSPTPKNRKRYTVALGGPIIAPESDPEDAPAGQDDDDDDEEDDEFGGETIGKKSSLHLAKSLSFTNDADVFSSNKASSSSLSTSSTTNAPSPRARAQSTYTYNNNTSSTISSTSSTGSGTQPLNPNRVRSRSTERLGESPRRNSDASKFTDPLVARRQKEVSNRVSGISTGTGKIGDLVKFFDKGNANKR